jgi:hypothetical protein
LKTFKTAVTVVAMSGLTMLLFWGFAVGTRITQVFWLSDITGWLRKYWNQMLGRVKE